MTFFEVSDIETRERLPGWRGRTFHSETMTFGYWTFEEGSSIHEHHHPVEEVWNVIEGELEITVDGVTERVGPGGVAIVPFDAPHSVRVLSGGRAIVVDHPVRDDV